MTKKKPLISKQVMKKTSINLRYGDHKFDKINAFAKATMQINARKQAKKAKRQQFDQNEGSRSVQILSERIDSEDTSFKESSLGSLPSTIGNSSSKHDCSGGKSPNLKILEILNCLYWQFWRPHVFIFWSFLAFTKYRSL